MPSQFRIKLPHSGTRSHIPMTHNDNITLGTHVHSAIYYTVYFERHADEPSDEYPALVHVLNAICALDTMLGYHACPLEETSARLQPDARQCQFSYAHLHDGHNILAMLSMPRVLTCARLFRC